MEDILFMTACGTDRPGVIEELLQISADLDVEVVGSKVMRFEGMFSTIMKLRMKGGQSKAFASKIKQRFPEMTFVLTPAEHAAGKIRETNRIDLVIDCMSRPGIEEKLEAVLQQLDYQVEESEYTRCRVANIGETVLSARYMLHVPKELSKEAVADEVAALAEGVRVNVA